MQLSVFYQTILEGGSVMVHAMDGLEKVMVCHGQFFKNDPLHIILKRRVLTGYPYKINKRKATVNMMFFNQPDVNFFKPIELHTRHGLKGRIVQSVGTKGMMKCVFNSFIKQHDIICLPLYKRVYPPFPFPL